MVGMLSLHRIPLVHADADVAWITSLIVRRCSRGRGVGRQLVLAAETTAREHGCARVAVTSAERRADAHAFYERIGYAYTGRRFVKQLA